MLHRIGVGFYYELFLLLLIVCILSLLGTCSVGVFSLSVVVMCVELMSVEALASLKPFYAPNGQTYIHWSKAAPIAQVIICTSCF